MTPQFWISVATFLLLILGLWRGIVAYRRQMDTQLVLAFTQRFDEIMKPLADEAGFPTDVFGAPQPQSDGLKVIVLRCLNLCSEEIYLHKRGYLADDIWNIWGRELYNSLACPLNRQEWAEVQSNYDSFPEFQRFVNAEQQS